MDGLDKEGILDNTVVIIYGDHDNKLKKSEYSKYYNYVAETDSYLKKGDEGYTDVDYYFYELNRKVPLIIWSKDKQLKTEVKDVMGMIDVSPTLGNMFGFKNKYALGNDIFSVKDNVVVFPSGNWLTNKMYYSQSRGEGKLLNEEETVSLDYIKKYNDYSEKLIKISNDIIVYDMITKYEETQKISEDKK